MSKRGMLATVSLIGIVSFAAPAMATVVSDWNAAALQEVRESRLGPPIAARALAIAHTCMYDAWAAYDPIAVGTRLGGTLRRPNWWEHTDANKAQAISFAAYRCLLNLYPAGASRLASRMTSLGYNPADTSTDVTTPTGIGNVAAAAVIAYRAGDGSNQYGNPAYADTTGYVPSNPPMPYCTPVEPAGCGPVTLPAPNHWQPLVSPTTGQPQTYIAPHWSAVVPFALTSSAQFDNDPKLAPPPDIFKNSGHYHKNVNEVLKFSRELDAAKKLVVEYWADGPESELPPGHWGLFAQFVSQRDGHTIDQDAKMFFAVHNASFDAGIVAWHIKRKHDGVRPVSAIRWLKQGQTIRAFGGPGRPTENFPGERWMPYNPGSNLTPAFPGYISGHAMFSASSAEVLRSFTGSDAFGFSATIEAGFGRVEPGIPAVDTPISFATFTDAAFEAALSRLYGGIHFSDDSWVGLDLGTRIGRQAWEKAQTYFDGTAP